MPYGTLLAASIAAAVAGASYAYLARRLQRDARQRGGSEGSSLRSFALWWATLALNILVVAATYVLAAFDALPFAAQLGVSILQRALLGIGVAALLRYLVYLRTGRDLLVPLALVYAVYVAASLASMFVAQPNGVYVGEWRTELAYARPGPSWSRALNLLVVLPSLVASIAYFMLYFKVEGAQRRYRVAVVSWGIIGWWALAIVAGQPALLDVGWLQVANRAASAATAVLILSAHDPPGWLSARLERADHRSFSANEGAP